METYPALSIAPTQDDSPERVRVIEYDSCDAIPQAIRQAVGLMLASRSSAVTLVPNPIDGSR